MTLVNTFPFGTRYKNIKRLTWMRTPMKSHFGEKVAQPALRYHVPDTKGMYRPIHFFLVTERMHQEILAERESILADLSETDRARQQKIFGRYDPSLSLRGFHSILAMFGARARR